MMKIFAGILGILGGLLGLVTFSGYLLDGYFLNGFFLGGWRIATGGNPRWASWAGSPRSPVSPRASRFSRALGRRAGLCLLVAGLIDMVIGTFIGPLVGGLLSTPA